ncbi:MAG: hypothetical protein A2X47_03600 [Lentisphaerae bacterium GWF2_38_69]|nr:MAG: hypothetical protein A2X47_03600 [Lentisphaerae bacterium GWF2_38_69]
MLRAIIKKIIPSKGDIFFILFEDEARYANDSAKLLVEIINSQNEQKTTLLYNDLKILKQKASNTNRRILHEIDRMFITPIDRGDIQKLSTVLTKLTKRISKCAIKLKAFNVDPNKDACLIKSADTLILTTQVLLDTVTALKIFDAKKISISNERINELEENSVEDLKHTVSEMTSGTFDIQTILKLEGISKNIDAAGELAVYAADLIMQISIDTI